MVYVRNKLTGATVDAEQHISGSDGFRRSPAYARILRDPVFSVLRINYLAGWFDVSNPNSSVVYRVEAGEWIVFSPHKLIQWVESDDMFNHQYE